MQCPNDGAVLTMSERSGIEIDYCPTCRGVWLDRGELDKIIERSLTQPAAAPAPPPQQYTAAARASSILSRATSRATARSRTRSARRAGSASSSTDAGQPRRRAAVGEPAWRPAPTRWPSGYAAGGDSSWWRPAEADEQVRRACRRAPRRPRGRRARRRRWGRRCTTGVGRGRPATVDQPAPRLGRSPPTYTTSTPCRRSTVGEGQHPQLVAGAPGQARRRRAGRRRSGPAARRRPPPAAGARRRSTKCSPATVTRAVGARPTPSAVQGRHQPAVDRGGEVVAGQPADHRPLEQVGVHLLGRPHQPGAIAPAGRRRRFGAACPRGGRPPGRRPRAGSSPRRRGRAWRRDAGARRRRRAGTPRRCAQGARRRTGSPTSAACRGGCP